MLDRCFENRTSKKKKKDLASELIKKAPRPGVDLDIQKRLEALGKDNNPSTITTFTLFIVTAEANTKSQTNCYPKPANDAFWRNDNDKKNPEKDQVLEDISRAIYEVLEPTKIEIGDPLLKFLSTDSEGILADYYGNPEELQDRTIEQIKEEYKFDEPKDTFDEGKIPLQLEFFLEATMIIFY